MAFGGMTLRQFAGKQSNPSKHGSMEPPGKNFEDSRADGKADYGGSPEASEGKNCGSPCKHHGQQQNHPGEVRMELKLVQPSCRLSKHLEAVFTHLNTVKL